MLPVSFGWGGKENVFRFISHSTPSFPSDTCLFGMMMMTIVDDGNDDQMWRGRDELENVSK